MTITKQLLFLLSKKKEIKIFILNELYFRLELQVSKNIKLYTE